MSTRSKRKPAKKPKPKGLPSPCPTPFLDLRTNDVYCYEDDDFPATAVCIRFCLTSDDHVPFEAFDYLVDLLQPMTSFVHGCIHADQSLLFLADVSCKDTLSRLCKVKALQLPGTAFSFTVTQGPLAQAVQDCLAAADMELGLENIPSDFSMPSSSEDESPRKTPAPKPAAKTSLPAVRPSLPAALPILSSQPPAAQPSPVKQLSPPVPASSPAAVVVPVAATAEAPPASSLPSAPASQPESSPPVDATPSSSAAVPAARRPRRFRFKAVNFQALDVTVPVSQPVLTVLVRSTDGTKFREVNSQKLAREIAELGATATAVRDLRDGGLALDFPPDTQPAPLLARTSLLGCPVVFSVPKTASTASAVVSGVHPDISEADILADMTTSPPCKLVAVKRLARPGQQSWSVKITVEGTALPERAFLYGRSRRVASFKNKPLQCLTCGRFGHVAAVCRSSLRCWTCGQPHETSACSSQAEPTCPNCGGAHPADAAHCPARQLEEKVCQVQAQHQTSFRTARVAVERAAKTYAAAAKSVPKAPAPKNRPPPLSSQPALAGGFLPSTPHHRPPQPPDHQPLVALFRGILSILTAAAASSDLSTALLEITALFKSHAPEAAAAVFTV